MKSILASLGIIDKASFWVFVKRFVKFGLIGISNVIVSVGIYYLVIYFNKNWYLVGNIAGWAISVATSYLLNRHFVFRDRVVPFWKGLLKCYVTYLTSLILSSLLLSLEIEIIGLSELVAPIINSIIMIFINFFLNYFFTFGQKKSSS